MLSATRTTRDQASLDWNGGRCDLEPLEARVLLSGEPYPSIDLLESPSNSVVRVETTLGTIDIELFADAAPGTLGNFLTDLRTGELDLSAFHHLMPGEFLQFGTFGYQSTAPSGTLRSTELRVGGLGMIFEPLRVDLDDPQREALAWTVSISESYFSLGSQAAVTINLTDNPDVPVIGTPMADIQTVSRVIGRVLPGVSRDTVAAIAELRTISSPGFPTNGDPFVFSEASPLTSMPVTTDFEPQVIFFEAPRYRDAVVAVDAETIKPFGEFGFAEYRAYYPEGFAGATISEFVPIVNPNDAESAYQLIARFETGERDLVIATGTIAANSRGGVTISDASGSLVPQGRPYALELVSTLPLGATLSHYDFGAATGETFTDAATTTWSFADAVVDESFHSFLVWQNTLDVETDVEVLFYPEDIEIALVPISVRTEGLRRGGLDLSQLDLPAGRYAIRINSTMPIVAALTQYDNRGETQAASTELGSAQSPARGGALPIAWLGGSITMFNPADPRVDYIVDPTANVTVTLTSADPNREAVQRSFAVGAGQIIRYDFADLTDELGSAPFAVRFTSDNEVVFRGSRGAEGDDAANPFSGVSAQEWHFAEGFMDPERAGTEVFETLGVYNTVELMAVQNEVTVTFRFTDGTSISEVFSLSPGRHLFLDLHTFEPLLEQAAAGRNFYSIGVESQFGVVAQLWHDDTTLGGDDPAGGFGTLGAAVGARLLFDVSPEAILF